MRRFRLSTLLLLVVIAALGVALVMQRRREADLQARLAQSWPVYLQQQREEALLRHWLKRSREYRVGETKSRRGPTARTGRCRARPRD